MTFETAVCNQLCNPHSVLKNLNEPDVYVGHLESKERLRIQPAQLFNYS